MVFTYEILQLKLSLIKLYYLALFLINKCISNYKKTHLRKEQKEKSQPLVFRKYRLLKHSTLVSHRASASPFPTPLSSSALAVFSSPTVYGKHFWHNYHLWGSKLLKSKLLPACWQTQKTVEICVLEQSFIIWLILLFCLQQCCFGFACFEALIFVTYFDI